MGAGGNTALHRGEDQYSLHSFPQNVEFLQTFLFCVGCSARLFLDTTSLLALLRCSSGGEMTGCVAHVLNLQCFWPDRRFAHGRLHLSHFPGSGMVLLWVNKHAVAVKTSMVLHTMVQHKQRRYGRVSSRGHNKSQGMNRMSFFYTLGSGYNTDLTFSVCTVCNLRTLPHPHCMQLKLSFSYQPTN